MYGRTIWTRAARASNERTLISGIEGVPDGICVDEKGNLYLAANHIQVYSPEGKPIGIVQTEETPSNCAFGDPDLGSLYITARTSVYRARLGRERNRVLTALLTKRAGDILRARILGVGALIFEDGKILLVERGKEPLKGYWSIPGGIVETGEKLEEGIRREVAEETGLDVDPYSMFEIFERIMPDAEESPNITTF